VKLFQREARLAAKLRHSNIVGVIDFGEIRGRSYMALELVDGVDLQVLLEAESGKRLSPEYVALIGHDLASALDHAHNPPRDSGPEGERASAIVHRDISPSNVLISRHGEIMLSDFGVAKAVSGASNKQSAVKGKIPYMSPEQLRLESVDGRADLFGVGVVLYEALSGRRPYEGGHDPATIMLILRGERQPLANVAPGVPPELCSIVDSLIEPDRDKRPRSAAELIEMLDPFVPSPRVRRELGRRVDELRPEEPEVGASGYPPPLGDETTAPVEATDEGEREKRTSGIVGSGESQRKIEPWSAGGTDARPERTEPRARGRRRGWAIAAVLIAGVVALVSVALLRPALVDQGEVEPSPPMGRPTGTSTAPIESENVEAPKTSNETSPKTQTPDPPVEVKADPTTNDEAQASEPPARQEVAPAKKVKRSASDVAVKPSRLTVIVYPWGDVWINGKHRGSAPLKNMTLKPGRYRVSAGQGEPRVTRTIRLKAGETRKLRLDVTK